MLVAVLAFSLMQQRLSVCEIQRKPSAFVKHLASVHAEIVSAMPHGIFLQDDSCPKNILLLGYDLPNADESVKNLPGALSSACTPDGPHKTYGQFVGRISYSAKGIIEFRLQSVSQLDYTPCPPPIKSLPPMHP